MPVLDAQPERQKSPASVNPASLSDGAENRKTSTEEDDVSREITVLVTGFGVNSSV